MKDVSGVYPGCIRGVSGVNRGCIRVVSGVYQGCIRGESGVNRGRIGGVSGVFKGSWASDPCRQMCRLHVHHCGVARLEAEQAVSKVWRHSRLVESSNEATKGSTV